MWGEWPFTVFDSGDGVVDSLQFVRACLILSFWFGSMLISIDKQVIICPMSENEIDSHTN